MKTKKIYLGLLLTLFIFSSCFDINISSNGNSDKINGEGDLVETEINTATFDKLNLVGFGDVTIKRGSELKITLRAQQNIIDILTHRVVNGELKLSPEENVSIGSSKGIFYEIETPEKMQALTITGSGNIIVSGAEQDNMNIVIMGAGNIDAFGVQLKKCEVKVSGAGNCNVNVREELNVTIAGVGNVSYKGSPNVSQNIMGVGKVINAN